MARKDFSKPEDVITDNPNELQRYNQHRTQQGKPPLAPLTRYKRPRGLNMSDEGWEGLRALAKDKGYTPPLDGNVTQLLEAIGHGLWSLTPAS